MIPSNTLRSGLVCNYYSGMGKNLLPVFIDDITSSGLVLKGMAGDHLGKLSDSKYLHKVNTTFVDVKIWIRDNP